jgi:hypothetical protein
MARHLQLAMIWLTLKLGIQVRLLKLYRVLLLLSSSILKIC